ncbi:TIGR04222 domain-containing membrane protein [Plantactinospora sp. S1510]|uniref:TIGR04222 domain-containing membrane protein n=1 Tax=Plantactinospora alkalitolerans TaxID=2789879 RepID=A0ABS0GWY8_9ACTN|nr:TIGR04222 domain-containing membrane protein [Plantactinospora alkalitolerans]MBF9130407.1 TIGR04222 domain-containing membrane protein [Plantactinospora alkalitolerans]
MIVVFWLTGLLFVVLVLRDRARARAAVEAGLAEVQRRQWRPPGTPDPFADVGPYDLARLQLGTGHAVDTAIVTLIRRDVLRISREGQVSAITGQRAPTDPLEQAVLRALGRHPDRQRPAAELRAEVTVSPAMADSYQRLIDSGMVTPGSTLTPAHESLCRLRDLSITAIAVPWLLLAVAALLPPANWTLAAVAMVASTAAGTVGVQSYLEGRRAVERAGFRPGWSRGTVPADRVAPLAQHALRQRSGEIGRMPAASRALLPVGVVVALCGLYALDDPAIMAALHPPMPKDDGDENSDGTGGGGGCGGCGGGCGGCGCGG